MLTLSLRRPREAGRALDARSVNYVADRIYNNDDDDDDDEMEASRAMEEREGSFNPLGLRRYIARRGVVGRGGAAFRRAEEFIGRWGQCELGWTTTVKAGIGEEHAGKRGEESKSLRPGLYPGCRFLLSASTCGVWISNPLLVTEVVRPRRWRNPFQRHCRTNLKRPRNRRRGRYMRVVHRTLAGHLLSGEEIFELEQMDDGRVWYSISSVSRPCHLLSFIGYPILLLQQTRFMNDSLRAVRKHIDLSEGRRGST